MAIIKCKMCGGELEITVGTTVAECEYCGSKQTVPTADNEKKLALFSRANRLRYDCEFDKAAGVYEAIVADFPEEAEAYWGLVLCKYGIEYVDDPATGNKVPTCHRSSFDSVMDDHNFDMVMEHSDVVARKVYREEAKQIEELRKDIIEVSGKEEPYDIFICYKETAEDGNRTIDSVLAQDVYDALVDNGYRVFFSRITLEDKLGREYEPYIFAALNSAKVMLAFGTSYDYYNAVWVKNEWSRYLQLMTQDKSKHLIPCYKDIDAYDMPKEFARLQAQDMGKVGASQDLLRGIEKLIGSKKDGSRDTVAQNAGATEESLLKRGMLFLEDCNWKSAEEYFDKVLDINPERAEAYLGKLMIDLRVTDKQFLSEVTTSFENNKNYAKAYKFADIELKDFLAMCYNKMIYSKAVSRMKNDIEADYKAAAELFKTIITYKDSKDLYEDCSKKANSLKNERLFKIEASRAKLTNLRNLQKNIFIEIGKIEQGKEQIIQQNERLKQKQISEIYTKISELQAERSKLGLFAISEKKEIDEKINELEGSIKNIKVSDIGFENHTEKISRIWEPIMDNKVLLSSIYGSTLGLSKNGTVIGCYVAHDHERYFSGENISQSSLFDWKDIVSLAIPKFGAHVIGLKLDGTVVAVGENKYGECDVYDWKDIVAISTNSKNTVGLKSDGTVVATGENDEGQCDVSDWTDIVAVFASTEDQDIVGLRADGTVKISGDRYNNVENEPYGDKREALQWTDIVAIHNEDYYIIGLKSDGTVVVAGDDEYINLDVSGWKDIVDMSACMDNIIGLKSDGTVVATGDADEGPCDVSGWKDIVAISADGSYVVGLKSDGTVIASSGCIDERVSDWKDIVDISANLEPIGFKADGTVLVTRVEEGHFIRLKNSLKDIKIPKRQNENNM